MAHDVQQAVQVADRGHSTGPEGFSHGRQAEARPQSSKESRPWGSGDRQRSLGQRAGSESHQALDFDKGFSHIIFL